MAGMDFEVWARERDHFVRDWHLTTATYQASADTACGKTVRCDMFVNTIPDAMPLCEACMTARAALGRKE